MTKQDLLARAKALGIKGRHEMPKDILSVEISRVEAALEREASITDERRARDQVARDLGLEAPGLLSDDSLEVAISQRQAAKAQTNMVETMVQELKVPRKRGVNLNSPWQRKYYFLDVRQYQQCKSAGDLAKAPMQVQLLLKYMAECSVTSRRTSLQGLDIASRAVAKGFLRTVIEPHVLFAYYRKRMEVYGLTFAGYGSVDEDPEAAAEADDAEAIEQSSEDEGE